VLGVVSRKYQPFQNDEAFAFCDAVVGTRQAKYETAGALRGGRRVWMLLKLPDDVIHAGNEDTIQPYLLVYNSFDGSSCLRALLTSVRVVCQNTLNLALHRGRGEGITIPHRGDLQSRVRDAQSTLGLVRERIADFELEVEQMRHVSMHNGRLRKYFDEVLPPLPKDATDRMRRNRDVAMQQLEANFANELNTLPGMRATLWAAFNAVSKFADHERVFRGRNDLARRENRLDSIWFGSSNQLKQRAYSAALTLAGVN
jgi:phage/plasmid-like protein (TIGR03299 family)